MKSDAYITLRKKYHTPLFHYLHIKNLDEQTRLFYKTQCTPVFSYSKLLNITYMKARKERLLSESQSIANKDAVQFVKRRLLETELLTLIAEEHENNEEYYRRYRHLMRKLYPGPDTRLFAQSLRYLIRRSTETNTEHIARQVVQSFRLEPSSEELFMPSTSLFQAYHAAFKSIAKELNINDETINHINIQDMIKESLQHIGADNEGWSIKIMNHGSNLAVSTPKKQVLIGRHFEPKSNLRLKQVIAHEVYGHVLRAINAKHEHRYLPNDEEGIAIMCEQLVAPVYTHKRVIRFMIVSSAWGIDGNTSRNFNDVYELAWKLNCIITGITEKEAKERAFYECARVFRGGQLSGGGAVMLKDASYLSSNNRIWQLVHKDSSVTIQKLLMI